nr:MAG TPA_asm: hypothetical protein [Bacteriophage sp.]
MYAELARIKLQEIEIKSSMITQLTGGDRGPALEGLRTIYYEPRAFKILPYRHNYTETKEFVETGFFMPYYV